MLSREGSLILWRRVAIESRHTLDGGAMASRGKKEEEGGNNGVNGANGRNGRRWGKLLGFSGFIVNFINDWFLGRYGGFVEGSPRDRRRVAERTTGGDFGGAKAPGTGQPIEGGRKRQGAGRRHRGWRALNARTRDEGRGGEQGLADINARPPNEREGESCRD